MQQEIKAGCLDLYLPSWYKASHIPTGSSFPSSVFLKTCGRSKLSSLRGIFMSNNVHRSIQPRSRVIIALVAALFAVSIFAHQIYFARPAAAATSVFINEIHYDNTGTDAGEAIEVAGPAGTNLTGWSIVLYNGSNGAVYDTDALSGLIPNQQNGFGTVSISYPSNGIQNGSPDGIALVNGTTVVQFLSYEGSFVAVGGPANGMTSTDIGVSEAGTEALGQSLRLSGTGCMYEDFTWNGPATATFNAVNTGQTFSCGGGDVAPSVSTTIPTDGAMNVATDANLSITFSENVNVTGNWFQISCATSGLRQVADTSVSGGPATFMIDPNIDFASSEQCMVTVFAAQVSDQDPDDPPDNMAANSTFSFTVSSPPVVSNIIINEADSDTPGTDVAEFIELYDGGVGNTSLNGLVVVLYNGSGDVSYASFDLDGRSTDANGYFVLGNSAVAGVDLVFANGLLQNGPDAVALYAGDATSFPNNTPVTTANLIDAVVYDTDDADDAGLLVLLNSGEPQVNENAGGAAASDSIQRCPNGSGGARNTSAYITRTPTPDGANSCPAPAVNATIHDIQGSGSVSPFVGQDVITTGIVTAVKSNGFFLQEPDASVDSNPATSEGIFVFTGVSPTVAVGDAATVTGSVVEFFNLTQISSSAGGVSVTSSGNTLPIPIVLTTTILNPAGPVDQLERFEGMRMHADTLMSVAPTNNFGETFTVLAGVPRPLREPGIEISQPVPPDPTSGMPDCCIPRWDQNPERIMIDSDGLVGSTVISVTSHVTFSSITGPIDFTFGDYKVLPETPPTTSANISAVPVPTPLAGEFTVAGFNIENFNNDATQRAKAALAIRDVLHLPDIIGAIEIFDLADLQALAAEIQSISGVAYEARLIEADGTSEDADQDVGFLVKTARVQIDSVTQEELPGCVGTAATCNTFIDPNTNQPALLNDRPPLVLRATVDPSGVNPRQVIVIVNHLRSFIDIETVTGEGPRVRAKRKAQGEFLADLLQDLQTNNPTTAIISVGDYNAYEFNDGYTDPIATIKGMPTADDEVVVDESPDLVNPNFVNLTDGLPAGQRYSFIFEGTPQALDHVIVNTVAHSNLQRYAIARNNADFPELPTSLFSGDATRPERNSDHDMPVAYFNLPTEPVISAAGSTLVNESCPAFNSAVDPGERVTVNLRLTNTGNASTSNLVATLQASGEVVAPSGPQSYGAIAPGNTAGRDFSFTAAGTCGDTITATLQLQDGAINLGTVTYSFRLGVDTGNGFVCTSPCGGVRLVVTSRVTRSNESTVQATITVQNIGSETANNVIVTTAKLGSTPGAPLPQSLGNLAPGATGNAVVNFANSTPGATSVLTVGGTYTGGTFTSSKRLTIP
jgi:predicted extracellular nuclease